MPPENFELMTRVLKEYYELGYTQSEIGYKEHISKSTVSRMLQKAKEDGYVTVRLNLRYEGLNDLEEEFKRLFHLREAHIVPSPLAVLKTRCQDVLRRVSVYLNDVIEDGDTVGVSWGNTMEQLSKNLVPETPVKKNLCFVQMSGSLAKNIISSRSYSIVENFADNYLSVSYMLPAPAIVDTGEIAQAFESDSQISGVLKIADHARIAVFGVGCLTAQSIILESGTLSLRDFEALSQSGAVCDILFHFLDIEGNIVSNELDRRTIGLTLEKLKQKESRIAVAVGERKAKAIIGALNSGVINIFFTDEITACKVMREYKRLFV